MTLKNKYIGLTLPSSSDQTCRVLRTQSKCTSINKLITIVLKNKFYAYSMTLKNKYGLTLPLSSDQTCLVPLEHNRNVHL